MKTAVIGIFKIITLSIFTFSSVVVFGQTNYEKFNELFKNGQEQTDIIKAIIDSTLKMDSGLNTKDYWIDFSKINYFDSQSIEEFLAQHTKFTKINSDSLLANDPIWKEYGYLQKMLIIFRKVETDKNLIKIEIEKIIATDGANGVEIIMKKEGRNYRIISSKITWIS